MNSTLIPFAFSDSTLSLTLKMGNRHGLIAGATGTGKTVTLRVLAEGFSNAGVPVFMADVKGDLSGIAYAGEESPKIASRVEELKVDGFKLSERPVVFWDLFGASGHPVRTTVAEMGPLLLSQLLNLNDVQSGVLSIVFKIADQNSLLLLDLKDLRALLQYAGEHAQDIQKSFGNVSPASIGAIQRALLTLEEQGGNRLFGEPALNIQDLIQTDSKGRGVINILAADQLVQSPKVYATLLLFLLSELFEELPEVGDLEKPKLVFFFDEAHLLFNDTPKILLEKIEQVVRLIRSKGVGIYFVSQNPLDVPETVLGQLGNRVQHALRAFTPRDQKAVRSAAETFRSNPKLNVAEVITNLGVGEALISCLDEKGIPAQVEKAKIYPPSTRLVPLTSDERKRIISSSTVAGYYEKVVDRESAFEKLSGRSAATDSNTSPASSEASTGTAVGIAGFAAGLFSSPLFSAFAKNAIRAIGSSVGRQIARGVMGSLTQGSRRQR